MNVFIDTSAFYALASRNDCFHKEAKKIFEKISMKSDIVTTSYVIVETAALLQNRGGHGVAVNFLNSVGEGRWLRILWTSESLHHKGSALFRENSRGVSLVDCVSFAAMRHYAIQYYFGFDEHFEGAGFINVMRAKC
jgi:predicted nucleic acid-binding protein